MSQNIKSFIHNLTFLVVFDLKMLKYVRFQCYGQILFPSILFFKRVWLTVQEFALQIKVTMSLTFATLKTTLLSTNSGLGVSYTHIFLLCNANYFCSEDHCQYY